MPKYRSLTLQELQELEKEFVEYLVLNGITADDWIKLKENDLPAAERMIELFSDVVFESIMRKVEYLECREKKQLKTFQCLTEKLVLVGMSAEQDQEADFTDPAYIQRAAQDPSPFLRVFTSEKPYSTQRELELFQMTQMGCVITEGKLFKTLCLALPAK